MNRIATNLQPNKSLAKAILSTGIISGTLDAIAAILQYLLKGGKHPVKIFSFIASGVFGKEALHGGNGMALWGLLFHFMIAMGWTILFFILYPRIHFMKKNRLLTAILYGIFVWLTMARIVLPLSRIPAIPFQIDQAFIAMSILILAIGLPLSYRAHYYFSKNLQE